MHSSLVRLQRAERMFGLSRGTFVCPGARLLFWARSPMRSCRTCPPVKTSCVAGKKSGPRNAHERVSVAAVIVDRRLPSVSVSLSHLAQKCAHAANQHLALDAETLFARRFCCHLHPHSPLVTARHNSNQREWLSQSVCASQHATFNLMLPRPLPIHSVQAIPMPADLGVFCLCLIARCSALELYLSQPKLTAANRKLHSCRIFALNDASFHVGHGHNTIPVTIQRPLFEKVPHQRRVFLHLHIKLFKDLLLASQLCAALDTQKR
jgi:hypothetical protein